MLRVLRSCMFSHGLAPLLTLPRSGPWGGVRGAVIHRLHENRTLHPTPASRNPSRAWSRASLVTCPNLEALLPGDAFPRDLTVFLDLADPLHFADSPLEERGFEPPVPFQRATVARPPRRRSGRGGASLKSC